LASSEENAEKSKPTRSLDVSFHLPPTWFFDFDFALAKLWGCCGVALGELVFALFTFFTFFTSCVFLKALTRFRANFNIFNLAILPPGVESPPNFHLPPNAFRDKPPTSSESLRRFRLTGLWEK